MRAFGVLAEKFCQSTSTPSEMGQRVARRFSALLHAIAQTRHPVFLETPGVLSGNETNSMASFRAWICTLALFPSQQICRCLQRIRRISKTLSLRERVTQLGCTHANSRMKGDRQVKKALIALGLLPKVSKVEIIGIFDERYCIEILHRLPAVRPDGNPKHIYTNNLKGGMYGCK